VLDDLALRDQRVTRLARFRRPHRRAVQALAQSSPRLEDLADTFPGLLFALATGFGSFEQRAHAKILINSGAPLRCAADALGLPWWLRRLPADAFDGPIAMLPDGPEFSRRIANLTPPIGLDASEWLHRMALAREACCDSYALWMARQRRLPVGANGDAAQSLLAAYAWHSLNRGSLASSLVRRQWTESMSIKRAVEEARVWSQRIHLAVTLGHGIRDTWFPAGASEGYVFVPLATLEDFLMEAEAMGNCLDQYGDQLRFSHTRLYSVRKGGRHIANLEIGAHEDDCAMPQIEQLRGPRNRRVAVEIWQATYAWLARQDYRTLPREADPNDRTRRLSMIRAIWRPYLEALGTTPHKARVETLMFEREHARDLNSGHEPANERGRDTRADSLLPRLMLR
jgi:hypothetical protein